MNNHHLLVGTNGMVGVNHLDRQLSPVSLVDSEPKRAVRIITEALASGANGLTFTSEPSMNTVIGMLESIPLSQDFALFPIIPSPSQYLSMIAEKGLTGAARDAIRRAGFLRGASMVLRGGVSLARRDLDGVIDSLIDFEISSLRNTTNSSSRIECVILHDTVTDLVISLGNVRPLELFFDRVLTHHGMSPGFATRNFVKLVQSLSGQGLPMDKVTIMAPFNELGFQMTPSRLECEEMARSNQFAELIAMSIFAGGQVSLERAVAYLDTIDAHSVAVGVSTEDHAKATFSALRRRLQR